MVFSPPYPPYDPTDTSSFSYETVVRRWPVIVTSIVDHLHSACNDLSLNKDGRRIDSIEAQYLEGKQIIARLSELKYHMGRDHPLLPIPDDGEPYVDLYNEHLRKLQENGKGTWFTAPWLYAECYLYRLIRSYFVQTTHWKDHDPFFPQKLKTFKQSGNSILQIATTMHEMEIGKDALTDTNKLEILFREMVQMCLWGNATDLSLLTHLSASDIERLQSVGRDAQAARQHFILRDDQNKVWEHISKLKRARIDFVLDNAGFELLTDLVFADFLVTFTPFVGKVVFHPKLIPWFVSDVTPPDFVATLASLKDAPAFFAINAPSSAASFEHLGAMVARWQKYLDEGVFSLSVPLDTPLGTGNTPQTANDAYWTSPLPYWEMQSDAPALHGDLKSSELVIFKGDLNYRKLTGDIKWPAWTDFAEALGPLAGSFPLLSLRTNKADVVVGVDRDVAERLDRSGEKWRVDGSYALISFLGRSFGTNT
ncbi:hypothetical protein M378DRAFT_161764 [Amanita muscaria Koide BX008]|uniref:Sugar phosphate phosphatase n=1 Tax=Amanita muscaria (strain Koide BX008) TaxID=946122 RepID=A0A0C2TFW6_AMAMK|nr:hypothetical protein M378DRAFT_161764 [Amanita muscaria Koide BX008]